jgi:hypothetical protein
MRTRLQKKWMKIACLSFAIFSMATVANAQRLASGGALGVNDFAKSANAAPGVLNGSVKVIDNKGTVKYLQTKNGLTTITNTTNDATTTTWQLGGTLTDDTYIDLNGKKFGFASVLQNTNANQAGSDVAATTATLTGGTGTDGGFTLLVRDEATGNVLKMLASDLVSGIRTEYTQVANASADVDVTVTGLPVLAAGTTDAKLFVFRNGAKLRSVTDFAAVADKVTIKFSAADLPMYAGDVIEVQYIK